MSLDGENGVVFSVFEVKKFIVSDFFSVFFEVEIRVDTNNEVS